MSYDLALSENFDLVVSASRDLVGVSGNNLLGQRIKIRTKVERDTWVLNPSLGSYLANQLQRIVSNQSHDRLPTLIMEAMRDAEDIEIADVVITELSSTELLAEIYYRPRATTESLPVDAGTEVTTLSIGIGSGGDENTT